MSKLTQIEQAFCKYLYVRSNGNPDEIFRIMVDAIGRGNGQFIIELCELLGCRHNMMRAAQKIIELNQRGRHAAY